MLYLNIWRALTPLNELPGPAERIMQAKHDSQVEQLLPLLTPLFGLVVLLFSLWDWRLDPAHAGAALIVRVAAVLLAGVGYWPNRLGWSVTTRCAVIYFCHAGAIIACAWLLQPGLQAGMGAIAASIFSMSVVTLRLRNFVAIVSAPTLLFLLLATLQLGWQDLANCVIQYLFALVLAASVMLLFRLFHQRAFLLEQQLLHLSHHDSLTGACNRLYLEQVAERELALAQRHGRSLAVAMLDIDHFKQVNDNYGHDIGDRVLQELVRCCQGALREVDHFGRLGGEEFICVLPETDRAEAQQCAERLRASLASLRLDTPQGPLRFTVSIGVAVHSPQHPDWPALLKAADKAMYRAKHSGRNCVRLAGTAPEELSSPPAPS
ncbi:GGDEF domain-containing protein [Rugamonas sp. CCM 8940]|uniref:GGDEF domain-containing protein n=1 Tax=Rugamonas sp. CCM 8940 TaxID=2765359 RepID=UPI0018F373F4|nr:GGDEF domain-containing protein [Rugamonas sp. CCM 8940]MBJ7312037.1 GGDEF domain-containing protein [Rugamonas sp. CCM 8940]